MPKQYLDKTEALQRVFSRIGYEGDNYELEVEADEYLEMSAGTVSGVIHYRVFLVAAIMLSQNLDIQGISEANKVVFTGQQKPIENLFRLQFSYDKDNSLTIPEGFAVDDFRGISDDPGMPIGSIGVI